MPFVYVLHFDRPLSHAEHYVGCTPDLQNRLRDHASGNGSHLTRHLHELGLPWRLATLYQCTTAAARRIERRIKDQHNGPRHCEICNPQAPPIPEATRYPIDAIPFPTRSDEIAQMPRPTIQVDFDAWSGCPSFIHTLMDAHKEELGFIPLKSVDVAAHCGRIAFGLSGDTYAGYTLFTADRAATRITIAQCVVAEEFRGQRIGRAMIEAIAARFPTHAIKASVREDLAANGFWMEIGFQLIRRKEQRKSKNTLNEYLRNPNFS